MIKEELINLAKVISKSDSTIYPYFIEVSIEDVQDPGDQLYLNQIPTSFYLEKEQADKVIETARKLLRNNEEYRKLLANIGARLDEQRSGQPFSK